MITAKIPIVDSSYYVATDNKPIKAKTDAIYTKYKEMIDNVCEICKMPKEWLLSIIFIESAGDENARHGNAIGLMQVDPKSCTDIVTRERKRNQLTTPEKYYLKLYLGDDRYNKVMKANMGDDFFVYNDMYNPDCNVLLGAMYLRQLIDEESTQGTIRIDRIMFRYNQGYYSKVDRTFDAVTFINNLPKNNKEYVLKFCGKFGTLDILV